MNSAAKLTIRRATLGDLPMILNIERASFPSPWSAWFFGAQLMKPRGRLYLVAILDEAIVGYIGASHFRAECHIGTLAVHERHRRGGIGKALLLIVLEQMRQQGCDCVTLEYRIGNYPAARLYEKTGFEQLRVTPGYYRDTGEDAVELIIRDLGSQDWGERLHEQFEAWRQRCDYELEIVI